jgi:hypothetical protein
MPVTIIHTTGDIILVQEIKVVLPLVISGSVVLLTVTFPSLWTSDGYFNYHPHLVLKLLILTLESHFQKYFSSLFPSSKPAIPSSSSCPASPPSINLAYVAGLIITGHSHPIFPE